MSASKLVAITLCILAMAVCACSRSPVQPGEMTSDPGTHSTSPEPKQAITQPVPLVVSDFELRGISVDMPIEDAKKSLGPPTEASYIQGVGADVLVYDAFGLQVFFDRVSGRVTGLSVQSTTTLTSRGIGVGATKEAVLAAYGTDLAPKSNETHIFYRSPADTRVLIGFEILDGKVLRIAVGRGPFAW